MSVSRISVLVTTATPDVEAEGIARSVQARADMVLVESRCLTNPEVDRVLESIASGSPCALVLVERAAESEELATRWLAKRSDLVVLRVGIKGRVQIGLHDPRLDSLLAALRELVEGIGTRKQERVASIRIDASGTPSAGPVVTQALKQRPLLQAAISWVHAALRDAVAGVSDENGDMHGLSVTRATLLQSLEAAAPKGHPPEFREVEKVLEELLKRSSASSEPLAVAVRVFGLTFLEFRMLLLGLAPELDLRFQRCIGFLLDEMGRRVGSLGLYASLLGPTVTVRGELAQAGSLARWLVFENDKGRQGADEPLRLDPFLSQWLLGNEQALVGEPRIRRLLRLDPWPGAGLLERREERAAAASLVSKLQDPAATKWPLLGGDDPAAWRALLELGTEGLDIGLLRIESTRFAGTDFADVEDSACRIARTALLCSMPVVIDFSGEDPQIEEYLRVFVATLDQLRIRAGIVCRDEARVIPLLGPVAHEVADVPALPLSARIDAFCNAARTANVFLNTEAADAIARRYPLQVDGLEHAMRLAHSRALCYATDEDPYLARFTGACKDVASEGVSHLAERIEPLFNLDQVVLPDDQKQQLEEIVDHVRLAGRVLDEWKFRDQLPYGRGVTVLFCGPSGCGKTMAAIGIARRLGIQILRLDLSKVVSKYIGDTEKNLDRVFADAQKSGSAILIDECEALLGKRSEVKDAHDRYANIEVAYLLQRMEAYDGLAILTTNLRQNLDPAFLRRLRFIVSFPRPDAAARKQIWRQCLPDDSHVLDEFDFRQLARKVELTGGHIRQISLCAAFIAAAAGRLINMEHIEHAAKAEFAKLGMPPVALDLAATKVLA